MSHVNATNFNGLSKLENILSQTEVSNPELTKEIQTLTEATKEQQARYIVYLFSLLCVTDIEIQHENISFTYFFVLNYCIRYIVYTCTEGSLT